MAPWHGAGRRQWRGGGCLNRPCGARGTQWHGDIRSSRRVERMTTPFLLHLLRHGAVEPNGRLMGRTDCAPTAEGITACVSQAAGLAVETLIASDLDRARSAGKALSAALDRKSTRLNSSH